MNNVIRLLPQALCQSLLKLDLDKLYEIRIRADKPVRICYGGEFFYLSEEGALALDLRYNKKEVITYGLGQFSQTRNQGFMCQGVQGQLKLIDTIRLTAAQISEIVLRAAEFSIYAVNNQISDGYITVAGGARIGIAGEIVYENDNVKTQKHFGSLVIRVPHQIIGSAILAFNALKKSANKNMLLISPPGCGKTTILRDLTRLISDEGSNVLLVDERNEIAASRHGVAALDVGINTDIISCVRKDYAFTFGIRSMRPDYIVTDELCSVSDFKAVKKAALSGVNIIASIHAENLKDLKSKIEISDILDDKIFGRFVLLSLKRGAGTYEEILDANFNPIIY